MQPDLPPHRPVRADPMDVSGFSAAAARAGNVAAPLTTAKDLEEAIGRLQAARRHLVGRPLDSILSALTGAVESWFETGSVWRSEAEAALPAATGFSPEMVRFALPFMLEPLRAPALSQLLDDELGGREALEAPHGPAIILHVLSGNLPGLAAVPIALTLAIKSATLVKAGRGDRTFPSLFAQSIGAVDPALAAAVATTYWPGGDRQFEEVAFAAADLVIAFGDNETVSEIGARRSGPYIAHGHRVSFALVSREIVADPGEAERAADALALDVSLWDQRGCLSPQVCFVEGDLRAARRFGELVTASLQTLAARLPPGHHDLAELLALRRFRDEAEWRAIGGDDTLLLVARGLTEGTVVVEPEVAFHPTPLGRSLRILPIDSMTDLVRVLRPARAFLEAAGLAAPAGRVRQATELLTRSGVHRVCPLGRMQRPPLAWRHGGRPRVSDWLDWNDVRER